MALLRILEEVKAALQVAACITLDRCFRKVSSPNNFAACSKLSDGKALHKVQGTVRNVLQELDTMHDPIVF